MYQGTLAHLEEAGWHIICASPPGGTDLRYRRCLLPRPDLLRPERGLRDEVDITACRGDALLLIECKSLMSESLRFLNNLGESDYVKLKRLRDAHPPKTLSALLRRGSGSPHVPAVPDVELALAVSEFDLLKPDDISAFLVTDVVIFIRSVADQ